MILDIQAICGDHHCEVAQIRAQLTLALDWLEAGGSVTVKCREGIIGIASTADGLLRMFLCC